MANGVVYPGRHYGGGAQPHKGKTPVSLGFTGVWGAAAAIPQVGAAKPQARKPPSARTTVSTDKKNTSGHLPLVLSPCGEHWVRGAEVVRAAQPASPQAAADIAARRRVGRPKAVS